MDRHGAFLLVHVPLKVTWQTRFFGTRMPPMDEYHEFLKAYSRHSLIRAIRVWEFPDAEKAVSSCPFGIYQTPITNYTFTDGEFSR
jgi:hypothetical protein